MTAAIARLAVPLRWAWSWRPPAHDDESVASFARSARRIWPPPWATR
jgi:hypothetical protein